MHSLPIRILIVDDHPTMRRGLRALLDLYPDLLCVGEAASGAGLEDIVASADPDVLLLDLLMPDFSDPAAFVRQLRQHYPAVRVVVLTHFMDRANALLAAGAAGYVLKDNMEDTLIEALRAAARGGVYVSPEVAQATLHQQLLAARPQALEPAGELWEELTPRQLDVLDCLVKGWTNTQIAVALSISEHTVGHHLRSIYSKLEVRGRTEAVIYAHEHELLRHS